MTKSTSTKARLHKNTDHSTENKNNLNIIIHLVLELPRGLSEEDVGICLLNIEIHFQLSA